MYDCKRKSAEHGQLRLCGTALTCIHVLSHACGACCGETVPWIQAPQFSVSPTSEVGVPTLIASKKTLHTWKHSGGTMTCRGCNPDFFCG
ncbi:hypothetical protein BJV77DRAFT_200313 [Russula vinacea]|nr:hypothetical protein BJV77DRAFT_200313 [Russula vinacea]